MNLIEIGHLTRTFGNLTAVDDLSLHVAAGEICGLVGQDGAGKTTTLRLICGAYQPTHREPPAQIHVCGFDMLKQPEQARARIGYLPQRFSLYEELTVMENIRFFAEVRGISSAEWLPRCIEILKFVGLDEFRDRRAGQLSGGMKQKLGLAAALVHRPQVLLLDEPTTGVDPVTRQDFWQLIIRLVGQTGDRRTAVLVSTPYMDEAARCTRLGFMDRGRLIAVGAPAALCARLNDRVLECLGQPLPQIRRLAQKIGDIEDVQMFGDRLHIRVRPGQIETVMTQLARIGTEHEVEIHRLRPVQPQLEDVFMGLVEEYVE